jgi:hypothetical protein
MLEGTSPFALKRCHGTLDRHATGQRDCCHFSHISGIAIFVNGPLDRLLAFRYERL